MYKLNSPIQLGILGCGSFVQRRILPILKEIDSVKVVVLQKRDIEKAKQLALKYNVPYTVSTRDELLQHPQVDAVFIATTNCMHEEDALACAASSKPTFCEKPLAPTVQSITNMIEMFQKQSIPLFVGQSLRFKFCVQKARELLQLGKLGKLLTIRAHFSVPVPKDNWRHEKARGGGVLQDIGVHLIDLIRFISTQEVQSIFAFANHDYQKRSSKAEQTAMAVCRLTNQATSSFECSFVQPFSSGFEIVGTKARLLSENSLRQSDDSSESLYFIENDKKISLPIQTSNIYLDELSHLADVLRSSRPPIIPAEEGLKNQKVIEGAYHSIDENREIQIR